MMETMRTKLDQVCYIEAVGTGRVLALGRDALTQRWRLVHVDLPRKREIEHVTLDKRPDGMTHVLFDAKRCVILAYK